ncbi:type I-C CRISPR-associated protein Cas7/Csd2 [Rhodanobacter thiooxydans]|uniref:Type I-C CRISPR-associated protein Cas7/Csd2 n=1 Tax=Rhodanobacter thiooxydans TaxID=416169 RepID=A0A154QFS3_9GAMM|nr:type I-C CRISPR-associated protein Cas7/Csd2 [Rhodanobacter thiooxydans]EIL98037.1 CRISPR-associated protein Csd2 family [Rhodanobacter thiooxydans LCS2]KZC23104.1 type I-C CRISPR-associated protein Cas7/Csd2 [Rhodanobacter thiooxydans]MCW0201144.1 type I-C CRISPR-associated protein Cas7/Csd2 [Rhodanobacter thiooxydans]
MSLSNRYDFVLLFEVRDGNPNGDPDAGNLPRLDAETGHGLVTDVSLKRKVRNFVGLVKGDAAPYEIYVKEKAVLNKTHERAYEGIGKAELLKGDDKKRKGGEAVSQARAWMCQNFFDVRTFGAVMSTGVNCGQVRGPVQLTFARSADPIIAQEHSITRMAVATEAEAEKQDGDNRTMGRKHTVPYGLYMAHGFVSSFLAKQTGFSRDDLELLWQALVQMFEHDRSAARGEMATRGLYVFKHESELGNAPAHALFERIQVSKNAEIPRSFADYTVAVNDADLPVGVTLTRLV